MSQTVTRKAALDTIAQLWEERWGIPIVSLHRHYVPTDVEGIVLEDEEGSTLAMVTWWVDGKSAELVTLNVIRPGHGYGREIVARAEAILRPRGVERLWLVTTNDNVRAIELYLRNGWRLVGVHLDHMDAVRAAKPGVPDTGENGLPLRDVWEFEKWLT
jgi:GNAT superfamily N-acetyltransferase